MERTRKTDVPLTYLAIELPKPINIACIPERPEWKSTDCAPTKRLKLLFSSSNEQLELRAKGMRGKHVVITGKLERQTIAGQMTPIIFSVTAIDAAEN